jgi:anti-sigma factor RsiW
MTGESTPRSGQLEALLHAYHDGELSGLRRWRFERRLRRDPALRRALSALRNLRDQLQGLEAGAATPDVWDAVALRLPAADARRAESAATRAQRGGRGLVWWLAPLGAAATVAVVLVAIYGGFWPEPSQTGGVVRWIDSGGRSVMVLDDDPDTTIIWVLDGAVEGAATGGGSDVV